MRELLVAVLAVLAPLSTASFCGNSGVPYSFEVLASGAPVLGCAQPSCMIADKEGKEDSEFLADIQGQVDGYFREGDRNSPRFRHESAPKFVANCSGDFNELSCAHKNQWVGGIEYIDHPRQPLILQCCTYEGLKFSQDVGVTTVGPGEAITGGEVIREGRQISFDVIANVRKVVEVGKPRKISYEVTVRRMNCLPDPPEPEVKFDEDATDEVIKVLSSATGNDLGTASKFKQEKKHTAFKKRIGEKLKSKEKSKSREENNEISGSTNNEKPKPRYAQHGIAQARQAAISSQKVVSNVVDSDRSDLAAVTDTDLTEVPTLPTAPTSPLPAQPQQPQQQQQQFAQNNAGNVAPAAATPAPLFNPFFPFPPQPLAFGAPSATGIPPITPPTAPPGFPTMATMAMPPEMRKEIQDSMTPKYYGLPDGMQTLFPTLAPLPGFQPFPTLPPPPAPAAFPGFAPLPAPAAAQAAPTFGGFPGFPGIPAPAPLGIPPAPAVPAPPAPAALAAPTFGGFPGFPGFPAFPTPTLAPPPPPAPIQAPAPPPAAPLVQGAFVEDDKGSPKQQTLPELVTHPPFATLEEMVKAIGTPRYAPQYGPPVGSPHFMPLGPPRVHPGAPLIARPTLPPAPATAPPPAAPQPLATQAPIPPAAAQGSVLASFPGFQPIPVAGLGQLSQPSK